jgi:hypothetical protein
MTVHMWRMTTLDAREATTRCGRTVPLGQVVRGTTGVTCQDCLRNWAAALRTLRPVFQSLRPCPPK